MADSVSGAGCEQDWCPGDRLHTSRTDAAGGDGGYENEIQPGPGRSSLVKRYRRHRRFLTEQAALRLVALTGLAPLLFGACAPHAALLVQRLEAIPLRGPIGGGPPDREIALRLAALLRNLHSTRVPQAGGLGDARGLSWCSYLRHRMRQRAGSLPLGSSDDETRLWRYFEAGLALIGEGGEEPVLLHHDLKPANILTCDDGSLRLCDFDQARGGDPYCDLGKLAWRSFADGANASWVEFLVAYGGAEALRRQPLVDFYRVLHGIGALAYWHDFGHPGYLRHARDASALVARHTGVALTLHRARGSASPLRGDPERG